jgi:hypothetical protein
MRFHARCIGMHMRLNGISTYVYVYSWFAYDDFMSMSWLYNMYVERDKVERNTCVFV